MNMLLASNKGITFTHFHDELLKMSNDTSFQLRLLKNQN